MAFLCLYSPAAQRSVMHLVHLSGVWSVNEPRAKMPFLGKDWRSPGWSWTKTENGWKRIVLYGDELDNNNREMDEFDNMKE